MRYRHLRRTVMALLAAVAVVLLAGVGMRAVLESEAVRTAAARWLEHAASLRGVELTVGELHWGLLPPRLTLDHVRVSSAGIRVDVKHVEADLARLMLGRRTVELGTVVARGAHIRLAGLPQGRGRRQGLPLRLRVRHLDLDGLSFEGRELPGRLAVSLAGVNAAWSGSDGSSEGYVTVDHARLAAPGIDTIEVAVRSHLVVNHGLDLPSWTITGDGVELDGNGRIAAGEGLRTTFAGTVDLARLDRMVRARGRLWGTVKVAGSLDTERLELVRLDVTAPTVEAAGFPFRDMAGRLVIQRDAISGILEHALLYGGSLSGSYHLAHLKGATRPHVVRVHGTGIALSGLLTDLRVPPADLAATFSADAELAWEGKDIPHARGSLTALLKPRPGGLPVAGEVRCSMEADGLLRFAADDLTLGTSHLAWEGPLTFGSWEPAWSVMASGADLAEVVPLVDDWIGSEVLPPWVAGTGDLQVTLSGPWRQLVVKARLDAHPLELPPVTLDRVVAEATVAGSRLRLGPTRFSVGDGYGQVEGGLAWGAEAGSEQLDLTLRGTRLPLAAVASWIGQPGRASGVFSFTGGLHGPLAAPRGSWALGLDNAVVAGLPLGDGSATVDLADARFDARALSFDRGLGGTVWWAVPGGEIGGDLEWPRMATTAIGDGAVRLLGETATVRLQFRRATDGPVLGHLDAQWPRARLEADADRNGVVLEASLADAVTASAELARSAAGLEGSGTLHLARAADLVTSLLPSSQVPLEGHADAHYRISWPDGGTPVVEGEIDGLQLELDQRPLRLLAPAPFTLSARGLDLGGLRLTVKDDELFVRAALGADGAVNANLSGTLDALLLRFLLPDWEPAGRITGVVELLGSRQRPELEGIAEVSQGSFHLPGTRTILSGIGGTLLLSSDEATLEGVSFRFMQGMGRVSGQLAVHDGALDLDLDGSIANLQYEMLPGLVAYLSGAWRLEGPTDSLDLSGDLSVDRATLQRKDDVATLLLDWFGGRSVAPSREGGPHLNLHVEADNTIDLRNPFLRLAGSASVHVTGTTSQPGVVGKVELEEGGEVTLQSTRYELERGALTFADPSRVEPDIEVEARTWVQNYQITVRLSGTPDRLVPSVASDPPLPENDVYSLLAMGHRDAALGGGALGVNLASGMLAREITSELDRRARTLLPVDQIRVDPFAESSTGNPTARISAIKQLSPTWTFMVQSNLSAEREQVVVSRWYLAPGIFVEASRDIDGSYGMDIKLRRPY